MNTIAQTAAPREARPTADGSAGASPDHRHRIVVSVVGIVGVSAVAVAIGVGHSHIGFLDRSVQPVPAAVQPAAPHLGAGSADTAARLDAVAAAQARAPFTETRARLDAIGAASAAKAVAGSDDTTARLDAIARAERPAGAPVRTLRRLGMPSVN